MLMLVVLAFCLFKYLLHHQSKDFCELEALFVSLSKIAISFLGVWCGLILLLTFRLDDLPLIGLLVSAIVAYCIGGRPGMDALTLLFCVAFGKAARFCLNVRQSGITLTQNPKIGEMVFSPVGMFLVAQVGLLTFASLWHLDMSANFYHGPRWMGVWNNPNTYGKLMGTGATLTIGLLAQTLKSEKLKAEIGLENTESRKPNQIQVLRTERRMQILLMGLLLVSIFVIGSGLVMSYSRGAWLGTAVGLLCLAWSYGKFKWQQVLTGVLAVAAGVFFFWNATADSAPWYVKRLDFGRPSAQHRVAAWRGALEMMRDHPLGVGWNRAVEIYAKDYSPPENGAAAISTNDYLMIGTQLGWPALSCFVAYVGLALRGRPEDGERQVEDRGWKVGDGEAENGDRRTVAGGQGRGFSRAQCFWMWLRRGFPAGQKSGIENQTFEMSEEERLQVACRSGAVAMAVAFWFDGGLFVLPTAAVFWVLLELGQGRRGLGERGGRAESGERRPG